MERVDRLQSEARRKLLRLQDGVTLVCMDGPGSIEIVRVGELDYRDRAQFRCGTCGEVLNQRPMRLDSREFTDLAYAHRDMVHGGRA